MKTTLRYTILAVALLVQCSIANAGRYDVHLVDVWGGAGYSAMINSYDYGKLIGGGGGMIGFGYEYQNRKFMLNVGPEFRIFSSRDNVLFENYDGNPYSTKGLEYLSMTKYYEFSKFHETQTVGQIMVPVMAGMNFEYWYFLAGAKVGYTVLGRYSQKGTLRTTITDDAAYEPGWEDLYSHNILTDKYASKGKNPFRLDATLSIEAGVNINDFMGKAWNEANNKRKYPYHFRAGVFLDYGLPNMSVKQDEAMVAVTPNEATTQSLHQSEWATSRLNSLLVGVKFTALLQLNKPKGKKPLNPRIAIHVVDESTGNGLGATSLALYSGVTKRTLKKTANGKGWLVGRYPVGEYAVLPSHAGYLPHDTVHFTHEGDLLDTIHIALVPEPVLKFRVVNAKTNSPISARLEFTNTETGKVEYTTTTDSLKDGSATIKLKYGNKYKVNVTATDFIADNFEVTDLGADALYTLQPVEKGRKYVINNLFFATNQTTILPESEESLQEIYEFLKDNKDVRIRIIGHTDSVGSDEANQRLSEGRANSVKANIVERGISADRIETVGKGESEPIDTNDTEEGRAKNRRVEFEIL